ncbi:hypothetical protein [Kribbella capetownensis]|uniref:hypothetical protein n=1 Tax=Kribbella capetownensis TaxID=1572659 RepID=UPI001EE04467|nr:hypothetical protein [Kribbella capetownensis]
MGRGAGRFCGGLFFAGLFFAAGPFRAAVFLTGLFLGSVSPVVRRVAGRAPFELTRFFGSAFFTGRRGAGLG